MKICKLKRIFRNGSLFIDDAYKLTDKEAERILDQQGCPTVGQIIERTKMKVDWATEAWVELETLAQNGRKDSKPRFLFKDNTAGRAGWHLRKGFVLLTALLIISAVCMAVMPEGRAFAAHIYQTVIQLFGNRAEIVVPSPSNDEQSYGNAEDRQELLTINEFIVETGYYPYTLDAANYDIQKIEYTSNRHAGDRLFILYSYNGGSIGSTQIWNQPSNITSMADADFHQFISAGDNIIYYTVDEIDGSYYGMTTLGDSILIISADRIQSLEEFRNLF